MVGTEIKERLLDNQFIAIKMGLKVDKVPSTSCDNFQFNSSNGRYQIKSRTCNILETILFDVQSGTGNWVQDVAKELGIDEKELKTIDLPDDLWKSHQWK